MKEADPSHLLHNSTSVGEIGSLAFYLTSCNKSAPISLQNQKAPSRSLRSTLANKMERSKEIELLE